MQNILSMAGSLSIATAYGRHPGQATPALVILDGRVNPAHGEVVV
jgi:hypothetical protein